MFNECLLHSGIKVSQNALEHCPGGQKLKPGAFWLQNYWISQPEPTLLGQEVSHLCYSNPIIESFKFYIFHHHKFAVLNAFTKFYKIEKKHHEIVLNTCNQSLIIWEPTIETMVSGNEQRSQEQTGGGPKSWTVPHLGNYTLTPMIFVGE